MRNGAGPNSLAVQFQLGSENTGDEDDDLGAGHGVLLLKSFRSETWKKWITKVTPSSE
jgi:hypothetical protein